MYDFVVVGVGPAGSRFARRAADDGYEVLALERGEVGTPLACSGHVSTDLWAFTPDGAKDALLQNRIYGARFHTDGPGSDAYPFFKDEVVSNVIDRVGLDRLLADAAREAGVDLRENHAVTAVEEFDDRVEVTARTPDGTETFEGRMVAGCDGPVSRVRSELGLPEPDEKLQGVLGFSEERDDQDFVDVHLTAPRFFAWRIPRGDAGVEYGLAAPPGSDPSARDLFEAFIDGYDVEIAEFCAGMIPIGPPERTTSHRGFLIGDAAAQTKPFTGGGICYGMTAADVAADVIDPERPETLADYETGWRDELATEIKLGSLIRRAYSLPRPVQSAGLRAFSGEIGVHMDRPTSFFSREHLGKLFLPSRERKAPPSRQT